MCARRFLGCRVRPHPAGRRRRASRSTNGAATCCSSRRYPKGHFEAARSRRRPGLCAVVELDRPAGPGRRSLALAARRRIATGRRQCRGLLHPPDHLSRARPLERAAAIPAATPSSARGCSSRARRARSTASGKIWAPRYRQAAYRRVPARRARTRRRRSISPMRDVAAAFDQFVKEAGDRPIILAGHSQGALHLERLLREKIAGKPIAKRIVAAYVVGWPISTTADLPRARPARLHRAGPDRLHPVLDELRRTRQPRLDLRRNGQDARVQRRRAAAARICCASIRSAAPRTAPRQPADNPGTLIPTADLQSATLAAGHGRRALRQGPADPRRRRSRRSGRSCCPGNNYHVYDYALFWGAIRRDAERRLAAWHR